MFTFWKRFEHQILGSAVSKATLKRNYAKYIYTIIWDWQVSSSLKFWRNFEETWNLRRCFCCCWFVVYCCPIVGVGSVFGVCFVMYYLVSFLVLNYIILIGKRELVALLLWSSWYTMTVSVMWLFLAVPWVGLQCLIVVFPDHTHLILYWWCLLNLSKNWVGCEFVEFVF